ncbi:MAG: hypothetical protein ACKPKO_43695, partial [Candidatus Fonsibacter sp.]
ERIVNLVSTLTRTLGGDMAVKLQLTCKSHKPSGKVGHINLHCGPKWAFNGLARWAEVVLNELLKPIQHIVESTAEFVQRLRGVKRHLGAFMIRIDVSGFYMSGEAVNIARDASAIIPHIECRGLMDDVLRFLLSNQYVTSSLLPSRVWLTNWQWNGA